MVCFQLKATAFERFRVDEERLLGVSVDSLRELFERWGSDGALTIRFSMVTRAHTMDPRPPRPHATEARAAPLRSYRAAQLN